MEIDSQFATTISIEEMENICDDTSLYHGGFIAWDEDNSRYVVAYVSDDNVEYDGFGSKRNAEKWLMQHQSVNEGLIKNLINNVAMKLFSKNYIIDWSGVYKWEKTPQGPKNNNIAFNALEDLVQYYSFIGKLNVDQLKKAQEGGFISKLLQGFWMNLKNRIMGNPKKLESMVKFNNQMSSMVPKFYNDLNNMFIAADKAKAANVKLAGDKTDDTAPVSEADEKPKADSIVDDFKDELPSVANNITDEKKKRNYLNIVDNLMSDRDAFVDSITKGGEDAVTRINQNKEKVTSIASNITAAEKMVDAVVEENPNTFEKILEIISKIDPNATPEDEGESNPAAVKKAYVDGLNKLIAIAGDTQKPVLQNMLKLFDNDAELNGLDCKKNRQNAAAEFLAICNDNARALVAAQQLADVPVNNIKEFFASADALTPEAADDKSSSVRGDPASFTNWLSSCNDEVKDEIKWTKGPGKGFTASFSDLQIAENSLYKIVVYFDAVFSKLYQGKYVGEDGQEYDMNLKAALSDPKVGAAMKSVQSDLQTINNAIQTSSAFGSLKESIIKECEKDNIGRRSLSIDMESDNRTINEALTAMKIASEDTIEDKKATTKPVVSESFRDKDEILDALERLKMLAFDDDNNENLVVEAPEDPNDPNAAQDPNAAPAAPQPDVAMNIEDLGDPTTAPAPAPEATPADAPVDPASIGMDPAAPADPTAPVDPTAAAPVPDPTMGGDPTAAAPATPTDPTAPADSNAAPAPTPDQTNVTGEQPNNPETDKFDVGVDKPVNDNADDIKLTDDEQEQLFTKINLLSKVPDLVNYGKYLYNITPENVDLNDIHYINTLYDLSVKLGLLTDEFENNNLLAKYDRYTFSVLSKNPEKQLSDGDQTSQTGVLTEGTRKIKTEDGGEVEIEDAAGLIMANDIDDYMRQKKEFEESLEDNPDETQEDFEQEGLCLGWLVTFSAVLFGYPRIKTTYIKKQGNTPVKKLALRQLTQEGYKDIRIISVEEIDPVQMLSREYAGMQRIEDTYTEKYLKNLLNESIEIGIPVDMESDIEKCIDLLNQEIMDNPEIDFAEDLGVTKYPVKMEDLKEYIVPNKINEDEAESDSCTFAIKKGDGVLSKMFFGSNCRPLCKCLEEMATTCNLTLEAIGNDDVVELTFKR